MAIYRCSMCDEMKDGDWNTCSEDPRIGHENDLMCDSCFEELEDIKVNPIPGEPNQFRVEFTADQLAIIKKLESESDEFGDDCQ